MKKKKKSFLGVIIALLLIAAIGAGVYKYISDHKETKEQITIKFDTDGGEEVKSMKIDKGSKIKELPTTIKDGYNFKGWYDKDDNKVEDGTKFKKSTTLTAKWEKVEEKKEPEKKEPEKKEPEKKEPEKKYSCPDGYTLEGTKCTQTVAAKDKCEGERAFDYNGKCVTITAAARKDTEKSCPKQHVTYKSFAGEVNGDVVNWGQWGCAYYKTEDVSKENCESHGFKWVTPKNACYVKWVGNGTTNTCDHLTDYAYITNPNSYEGVNGMNGGCFPVKEKVKYCEEGYTLSVANCVKTIDATQS